MQQCVCVCLCTRTKESCLLSGELVACGFLHNVDNISGLLLLHGGLGVLQSAMVQVTEAYVL
jgi:hypothetical protein